MKSKKLILTFYVGLVALSSVGLGFSIAWYASSANLYVDTFNVSIIGEAGLFISESSDIETAGTEIQYDFTDGKLFEPVTSAYSSTWMNEKSEFPKFYVENERFSATEYIPPLRPHTSGYLSKKLYLFSDQNVNVTIDPGNLVTGDKATYIEPDSLFNNAYASTLYNEIQASKDEKDEPLKNLTVDELKERLNKLPKAMRFSVLIPDEDNYQYAIIDPNRDENEVQFGGLLDVDVDRYYDFYRNDLGNLYERVYGEINDRSLIVYDDEVDHDSSYTDPTIEGNAFNAKHKANVKTFNYEASLANGLTFEKEKAYTLDQFEREDLFKPFVIPVYAHKPQEIILSIYIEGWDLESVNYTMGATFDAAISFTVDHAMI